MEKRHCPYLGIIDDPTSHAGFPDGSNACHRAKKPVKIALDYQQTHCLCDAYQECQGYTKGWENGFPLELRADYDPTSKNIFKKIQFWKEEQLKKLSQKKELKAQQQKKDQRDWKERLQSRLQIKKEKPSNEQEKIILDEETISEKEDITQEIKLDSAIESQEKAKEKTILRDEAALKQYLRTKRKLKNPLRSILSRKEEPKEVTKDKKPSIKEPKTKLELKKAFLNLLPWKKEPKPEDLAKKDRDVERVTRKEKKQKKSLKEVLQNILPWKKEKRLKPERKKAIQDELTSREKEQIIGTSAEVVRAEKTSKEEVQPFAEEQEVLPNVWVKEEDQLIESSKEISQEEVPQWERQIKKDHEERSREEILPDVMAWRDRHISKQTKKEGLLRKLLGKKKEKKVKEPEESIPRGVMALRDKKRYNTAWKKAFTDKRVWLVSLGIILIFLLVIFIPQLPSVNLNLRDRLDGLFNPPISGTTATVVNPSTGIPGDVTQTEGIASGTTEVPTNTPIGQATPTITATSTITPTSIPTSTPTPGPPPFIYLTKTETP